MNIFPFPLSGTPLRNLLALKAATGGISTETVSGRYVQFSASASLPVASLKINADPVQAGTGDPSPQNIRPISGWTGCNVIVCGRNLYDVTTYPLTQGKWINGGDGTQSNNVSYASTTDFIPFYGFDGEKITLNKRPGGGSPGIAFYAGSTYDTFVGGMKNNSGTAGEPMTATVPAGTTHIRFTVPADTTEIMLELGETASEYEAYSGDTYAATWTEAGTVYGGVLNWTTGKLTVTDGVIASYDGEALPGVWISDRDTYAAGTTPTTGAQVVYKLAEPVVYTLSNLDEVDTLAGVNTFAADTGGVTVRYSP